MGHLIGKQYCQDHVLEIAKNISIAVHKAPMITGKTNVEVEIIWGEDLEPILEVMGAVGQLMRYVYWDYETIKNLQKLMQ